MNARDRDTAEWYRGFAAQVAHVSPTYRGWAEAVAQDAATLALLERLPEQHRQPPLVLAVARLLGTPDSADGPAFLAFLREHEGELARELPARPMQTNEPGRCSALLLALERIEGPVALLELGASAGLCLYPDRYGYDYSGVIIDPHDGAGPLRLSCRLGAGLLAPTRLPQVVWRAGIDLRPLDVSDDADVAWLEALAWPGQHDRLERVRAACDVVRADPPLLLAGEAEGRLDELLTLAPGGTTVVIVTSGVLVYLPADRRARLVERIRASGAHWVSLEGAAVLPEVERQLVADGWAGEELRGRFVVALDEHPLAFAAPYGEAVEACWSDSGA